MSRDLDYAADMLAAARLAMSYVEGIAHEDFLEDSMRQDAVIRELLIVGEAAKRVSSEFRTRNPSIPWRQMTGMRDILVHAYDHVDMDAVWTVVTEDLKDLVATVEALVEESQ